MALIDYSAAQKLGKRRYQESLVRGRYSYLPVLDNILSYTEIASTVSLGTMDIPLSPSTCSMCIRPSSWA